MSLKALGGRTFAFGVGAPAFVSFGGLAVVGMKTSAK
jgi:hypothetical protein